MGKVQFLNVSSAKAFAGKCCCRDATATTPLNDPTTRRTGREAALLSPARGRQWGKIRREKRGGEGGRASAAEEEEREEEDEVVEVVVFGVDGGEWDGGRVVKAFVSLQ